MSNAVLKTLAVKTLTAGGTPERIFPAGTVLPKISSLFIKALAANTGNTFIGDSTVLASTFRGREIIKGTELTLSGDNGNAGGTMLLSLESLYYDGTTGDKIAVSYLEII